MNWIIYAIFSTFAIGIYNLFLEGSKSHVDKDLISKHIYLLLIIALAGIISMIILFIYYFTYKSKLNKIIKNVKYEYFIFPAILLNLYMLSNILALSNGGGIAMTIINLNLFITIIGGVLIYKDKINAKIILCMLLVVPVMAYISLESMKINKK
tara:strand:- start:147 stop:608 length:462 start_codon:yes stop_codon:yes gene_type:complete